MWRLLAILFLSLALSSPVASQPTGDVGEEPGSGAALEVVADPVDVVPQVDLSTPRSTVRAFVFTMQRASNDRPELIDEAVRCLDVTWLDAEDNAQARARQLAARLFEVLGSIAIAVEDVPDTSRRRSLALWPAADTDRSDDAPSITLVRRDDEWRFSRATLQRLDDISAEIAAANADADADGGAAQVRSSLRSPRATMETFLQAMNANPPNVARAANCLEPPAEPSPAWPVLQHDHAYRLYSVLLRVRAPVLSDIPERPQGPRYTWYVHEAGRVALKRMDGDRPDEGVGDGEWRFSRSTLSSLEELYGQSAHDPVLPEAAELGYGERLSLGLSLERAVPGALRVDALGLAIWKWLGVLCLLFLAVIVFALAELGARVALLSVGSVRRLEPEVESPRRLSRAFGWLVVLYALSELVAANLLLLPAGPLAFIYPFSWAIVLIAIALVFLRLVQLTEDLNARSENPTRHRVGSLLLPLLESFFRLIIAAIVIAFVLRLLGFSRAAVLGGLGLLGAAVGFAAQGSIANIVAALSIVYDRPFRVGDWVNLDGMDATVERLGLVSVRLRTFYNSLVVVPNSQIVTKAVDNYGERRYRRLRHFLRLRYDTPAAKIDALCEGLRELVRLHPYTRKDYYHLYLNELTPSSANVLIYIFFEVPDWATELRERHRFLIDALALVEELGIELAYPTQRLLVEEVDNVPGDEELPGPPEREGARRAKRLFSDTYGDPPKERGPVVIDSSPLTAGFDDEGGDEGDGV